MTTIESISSLEGRKLLIDIFHELRYEKQLASIQVLFITWKLCVNEREIFKYSKKEVTAEHKLGLFSGTGLWMEEVVNRFYYSTINSFVYFGAAILLVLIGIRRFTDEVSDDIILAGIALEAVMLMFLFVVMYFTPHEAEYSTDEKEEIETLNDLIIEVGEISRDFAEISSKLEKVEYALISLIEKQGDMVDAITELTKKTADAVAPNPLMLEIMKETNVSLAEFKSTVDQLNDSAKSLRKDEIEYAVKKEVEKLIMNRLNKGKNE